MTTHFCSEHNSPFFMKGGMKSFAHPIKDENDNLLGWCNEPKGSVDMGPMKESAAAGKAAEERAEPPRANPENKKDRAVAMSYAKDLVVAGVVELKPDAINKWANYFYYYITGKADA